MTAASFLLRDRDMWKGSVPIFRLIDGEGREFGTEPLWQKREMLIAILDAEGCAVCRELERALRSCEDEWSRENVGLVVLPLTGRGLATRVVAQLFETLEPHGIAPGTPTLAVADRFGRLRAALDIHAAEAGPAQLLREAREWLDLIQEQCDECGVSPEEPAEAPLADSADDGRG